MHLRDRGRDAPDPGGTMQIGLTLPPSLDLPHQLSRYRVILLLAVAPLGCDEPYRTTEPEPGSIALSLTPTSPTVQQGANTEVTVTVTRSGAFTGGVGLIVSGAPNGVATNVLNLQTTGAVTTATVAISVMASTTPGTYNLTVRANGQGVVEAVASFALTVTVAPAYTLSLSDSMLTIARGASTPTTMVNIARTNFTAGVQLGVVLDDPNHCECLPAGITAAFNPNPATEVASVLTITVANTVAVGVYRLVVFGLATNALGTHFVYLTLTVT
jgi:hypothetical protein